MAKSKSITIDGVEYVKSCKNGHKYSDENNYIGYDGTMVCRRCRYNRVKRYRSNNMRKLRQAATV